MDGLVSHPFGIGNGLRGPGPNTAYSISIYVLERYQLGTTYHIIASGYVPIIVVACCHIPIRTFPGGLVGWCLVVGCGKPGILHPYPTGSLLMGNPHES